MQQMPFSGISGIGAGAKSVAGMPSALPSIGSISSPLDPSKISKEQGDSFGELLASSMGSVNTAMGDVRQANEALLTGRLENLHDMTIAGAKSEVMMKLTTSITGKLAQATTQLFQMQI